MKIGILHLSDLHIEKDNYLGKVESIYKSCEYEITKVSSLYIVITGDITKFGRKEEFENAKVFLNELKVKFEPKNRLCPISFVLVPGNHDCCFDDVKATRKEVIKSCLIDVIEEKDYFDDAIAVQKNYWEFHYQIMNSLPDDKISFKIEFKPHIDYKITFHCYNSSWMSEKNETYGGIVIPENKFLSSSNGEIVISLSHHPVNWLSTGTKKNNKSRFDEHLINSSNLVLFGHEHDKGQPKNIFQRSNNVIFSEGKAFQKEKLNETGYSFYEIDLGEKTINSIVYEWSNYCYLPESKENFTLMLKKSREFSLKSEFYEKLEKLNIPLKHSKKNDLSLSDVFVYPDLEPITDKDIVQYPNSSDIINKIKKEEKVKLFIEGEDQSGKTTLFFILFKKLFESGYFPVYIRGKHINNTDTKDIIKKSLKEQYENYNVDLFLQQEKIVILLDNLHKSPLNIKYRPNLLKNIDTHFKYILISSDNNLGSNLATEEITIIKDFDKYKILPLGYEKRSELIEKWLRIGENKLTIQEENLLKLIQSRLNEVNNLIGNRLMPSYPIFILTLLQGLDAQIFPHDYSQTSYAHCYHALITAGLIREGLKDDLTSYFNVLKELSYYLFIKTKQDFFSIKTFDDFYFDFKKDFYINHSSSSILQNLINANILKLDDANYMFSYKYIFYYLIAQKISMNIDKHEELIEELCENIHVEKNANILIFLTHHSKAQLLIDNILFTSELPFEDSKPITLDKDDTFSLFIQEFVKSIQTDIIEERDPKHEVKKDLKRKDDFERKNHKNDVEEENKSPEFIEISQAFRTIKILGQIVKNQKGDFEKRKLEELVESAYKTNFRFIGFFTNILQKEKDHIIEAILEDLKEKSNVSRPEIEKSVLTFLQLLSYRLCIDSFTNLMFAVGTKGIDELYETVAKKIDSSASKIVTFAIKSYYGSINVQELKTLFKEVENNYLAQNILRVYVRKHIYTNYIDTNKKNQIIKIAGFRPNTILRKKSIVENKKS